MSSLAAAPVPCPALIRRQHQRELKANDDICLTEEMQREGPVGRGGGGALARLAFTHCSHRRNWENHVKPWPLGEPLPKTEAREVAWGKEGRP